MLQWPITPARWDWEFRALLLPLSVPGQAEGALPPGISCLVGQVRFELRHGREEVVSGQLLGRGNYSLALLVVPWQCLQSSSSHQRD